MIRGLPMRITAGREAGHVRSPPAGPAMDRAGVPRREAVETAFMNRPELYQGEFDVRLQEEALRVYRSDYWPSLEAWGWHKWAKPDPHDSLNIEWDTQCMAGLRLTWSLFDGLRRA